MQRWLFLAVPAMFLFGTLPTIRADARPMPPPEQKAKLIVEVNPKVKEPHLIIPRSLANPKKEVGLSTPTIVAGVALTLAMVSAGFWFIRRGPGRTTAAVVVVLSLFALGVSTVFADISPRPKPPVNTPVKLPADVNLTDDVVIEFVDKGDAIRLIVNKATSIKAEKTDKTDKPE